MTAAVSKKTGVFSTPKYFCAFPVEGKQSVGIVPAFEI